MEDLTEREEQIIWMVSKGVTTPEIARSLFIAEPTVRNHVQSILHKTGTNNRLAAVDAWRNRKPEHAERILGYCKGAKIAITQEQETAIRKLFAERVRCENGTHRVPPGDQRCECKALSAAG